MTAMRSLVAISIAAASLLVSGEVTYDAENRSVTFTAVSTDCGVDAQLEFLFVGPKSDRDYEAMFMTTSPISEIVDAFSKAGIPVGKPFDPSTCTIWAVGKKLVMEPRFADLVKDHSSDAPLPDILYTGGLRDGKGTLLADKEMPSALFALYNCPQSPILFDDDFEQSKTYGRFSPRVKIPKGEKRKFTFRWTGSQDYVSRTLHLAKGEGAAEAIRKLIIEAKTSSLSYDVLCDFSPEMTLKEAVSAATALRMVDSQKIKINGVKDSQMFYKAFLPMVKWRDRKERLAQPPEVHFKEDGTFLVTEIAEDWSDDESSVPRLIVKERTVSDADEAAKLTDTLSDRTSTVFFYAKPETTLEKLYGFRKKLKNADLNIYVFDE